MRAPEASTEGQATPLLPSDAAAWATQVEAAWAAGPDGWDALAAEWGVGTDSSIAPDAAALSSASTAAASLGVATTLTAPASPLLDAPAPSEPAAPAPNSAAPPSCWWDAAPWHGRIADAEFRAIVAAYVERHGRYTPDLPLREPGVLQEWLRVGQDASPASPRAAA